MELLAQAKLDSFWKHPNGSSQLWMWIAIGLVLGIGLIFLLMNTPAQARRPIIVTVTFVSGLFYVMLYLWPSPIARDPGTLPVTMVDRVGFWLEDAVPIVSNFSNILSGFLLGLGIYSVARIHLRRLVKQQTDWFYSLVLIFFVLLMVFFGYWDYINKKGPHGDALDLQANWHIQNYMRDLLFNGLFQQMNAAMFSMIAFYILSAAYRAFRIRSIEATILLSGALIMILSLMGAASYFWDKAFAHISSNLTLTEFSVWLTYAVQTPSLRGIDFGIGIGALAMGLRLWLSLERTGAGS